MKKPLFAACLFGGFLFFPGTPLSAQQGEKTLLLRLEGDAGGIRLAQAWKKDFPFQYPRVQAPPSGRVEVLDRRGRVAAALPLDLSIFNMRRDALKGKDLVQGLDEIRPGKVDALVKIPDLGGRLGGLRFLYERKGKWEVLGTATAGEVEKAVQSALPMGGPVVKTILSNGPVKNRYDMVILGDGYRDVEISRFYRDVNGWIQNLFSREPYKSYKGFFNVHTVFRASKESGASHPDRNPPIIRNNAYGATYNFGGTPRCLYITKRSLALSDAALAPDVEGRVVVFVNDSRYGGCGGTFSVSYNGSSAKEVQTHELGHSFGLLADEYGGSGTYTGPEPRQANVTADKTGRTKWPLWLGYNGIGLFEGAMYRNKGIWRPKSNCLMRSLYRPLCEICVEQILKQCYVRTNPIEDPDPPFPAITLTASNPVKVSFKDLVPGGGKVTWSLDGKVLQSGGTSFVLKQPALPFGRHKLTLKVEDRTSMVRKDPSRMLVHTRDWQVDVRVDEGHTLFYTLEGSRGGAGLGSSVCGVGDVDGDGFEDFAAGGNGVVRAWSGASGREILAFTSPGAGPLVAGRAGDVNKDGRADLLVGIPGDSSGGTAAGRVLLVSGKDGKTVLRDLKGQKAGDRMGAAVLGLGDVNGDGYPDFAAGAPGAGGTGLVRVVSGKDGSFLRTFTGTAAGGSFGAALAGGGDVDGDGRDDLAVGAPGSGTAAGRAFVFSPAGGKTLLHLAGKPAGGKFGFSLALPGDLDGDGKSEVAVGSPQAGGRGLVQVFSGKDGTELFRVSGINSGDRLGYALSPAGDVDRDKKPDLLAGAPGEGPGGTARFLGGAKGVLLHLVRGAPGGGLGTSLALAGDLNKDGYPDQILGEPRFQSGAGRIRVLSKAYLLAGDKTSLSLAAGGTQVLFFRPGIAQAGKTYLLLGCTRPAGSGIRLGAVTLPLAKDGYFDLTILGANSRLFTNSLGTVNALGYGIVYIHLPKGLPPSLAGTLLKHSCLVISKQGTFDLASNLEVLQLVQ